MLFEEFWNTSVFANKKFTTAIPDEDCKNGFDKHTEFYLKGLETEKIPLRV